jgi:hypothetical protein
MDKGSIMQGKNVTIDFRFKKPRGENQMFKDIKLLNKSYYMTT